MSQATPGRRRSRLPTRSRQTVVSRHGLGSAADYRAALREWFRVVRLSGHLVIVESGQAGATLHPDGYTPARLLAEIEEALDPVLYRVRHLEQDDGTGNIVVVVQRVGRPDRRVAPEAMRPARSMADPRPHEPLVAIESASPVVDRILVLKLDHRGDFIMARAGFETLRARFPDAHITLACGPWNREEARRLALFDRVVGWAVFPEVASQPTSRHGGAASMTDSARRFAGLLADRSYDLAIDMRLHEDTRELLRGIEATIRAGFGTEERFPFLDIALPMSNPTRDGRAGEHVWSADRFDTHIGRHTGPAIVNPEHDEARRPDAILVSGPYANVEAGEWDAELLVEAITGEFQLAFDVTVEDGRAVLGTGTLWVPRPEVASRTGYPRLTLSLPAPAPARALEIRLRVDPSGGVGPFRFTGCRLTRRRRFAGLHQQEMQLLLCTLVGLRMRHPWRLREVA